MSHLITDEMVDLFAIRAANDDEVAERILDRYGGVADRICIFNLLSTAFGRDPDRLTAVVRAVQAGVSVMV
jgi:hypothetical protein